jgi:hypothetical protein
MSAQYRILRNDEDSRKQRCTIADALDVLVADAGFRAGDIATIITQGLQLPDWSVAWLVALTFDGGCRSDAQPVVVFLRTASEFFAIQADETKKEGYPIDQLHGGNVDYDGVVIALNGDRFRAVELKRAILPYEPTPLERDIVSATLSTDSWASRDIYRDLCDDLPVEIRRKHPTIKVLDYSKLVKEARLGTRGPMLKEIQGKFADLFQGRILPSPQQISNTLEKIGIRLPHQRRKRTVANSRA